MLQDVLIASLFGILHTGDSVVLYNEFFASRPEDRPGEVAVSGGRGKPAPSCEPCHGLELLDGVGLDTPGEAGDMSDTHGQGTHLDEAWVLGCMGLL